MGKAPPPAKHDETILAVVAVCVVAVLLAFGGWLYWSKTKSVAAPMAVKTRPVVATTGPGRSGRGYSAAIRQPTASDLPSPDPAEKLSGALLARVEIVDDQWLKLTLQNTGDMTMVVPPEANIVDNLGYPRTGGIFLRYPSSTSGVVPFVFASKESSFQRPAPLGLAAGEAVTASYSLERLIREGLVFMQHSVQSMAQGLPAGLEYRVIIWWNYPSRVGDYMISDWRKFPPAPALPPAL